MAKNFFFSCKAGIRFIQVFVLAGTRSFMKDLSPYRRDLFHGIFFHEFFQGFFLCKADFRFIQTFVLAGKRSFMNELSLFRRDQEFVFHIRQDSVLCRIQIFVLALTRSVINELAPFHRNQEFFIFM